MWNRIVYNATTFFLSLQKSYVKGFPLAALARAFIENVQIAIACRCNSLPSREQVRLFGILSVTHINLV